MNKSEKFIKLNKPSFPPIEDFFSLINKLDFSRELTNGGEMTARLENKLCDFLGINYISLMSSGTLALTLALKSLDLKGEIITTAFTSPATLMACYWNNLQPVFADTDSDTCNLSPESVRKMISPKTSAILPVHVYAYPCRISEFEKIATEFNLKIIYDASHCFGAKYNSKSLCNYGDISVISFHATKVFNTVEGGAVICNDKQTKDKLDVLKNTGISSDLIPVSFGLNAKMSELNAAFGLALLPLVSNMIEKRKISTMLYHSLLRDIKGIRLGVPIEETTQNYAYLPVFIDEAEFGYNADMLVEKLLQKGVLTRRYFYPLLSETVLFSNCKKAPLVNAQKIVNQVLCLPLYDTISSEDVKLVCGEIMACCNYNNS